MCGICGVYSLESGGTEIAPERVAALTGLMARRGPDDEGYWNDDHCAFGFRRLAILDLSPTGHQPMLTEGGRYVLIYNGELYNYQEIKPELEARGVRFRSTGDAEVVLYALAEWGPEAFKRFNGMYALAFYDTQEQTLLLGRDHAGIKPLYYLHTDRGLVFASQYNQLISHPYAAGLKVTQDALALYMRFGNIPAPYAALEKTHMLESGCWVRYHRSGKLEHGRFYEFPKYAKATIADHEAVDALDEAVSRAVKRHLLSDVPVGVFLSGGIDSPLVAVEAKKHKSGRMKAFTIGVPNSDRDESENAIRYAEEIGVEQILEKVDEQTALDRLDDVVSAVSEPLADFSIFPTLIVSGLARQHVTVALSGDGGDELFWGYPSRFGTAIAQAQYFRYPKPLRYGFMAARKLTGRGHATSEILYPNIGRLYQKKHTLFSEDELTSVFPTLPELPADFTLFDYAGTDPDETAQWLRWNEWNMHLAYILLKVDRASMFHSLESRVPLLDKEVINVSLQTKWGACLNIRKNQGKIPLRRLLNRRLKFQTEKKKGFVVPMFDWLAGPLQPMLRELVLERDDILGLPMNKKALAQVNAELLAGKQRKAWGLWQLMSLALWEQRHLSTQAGGVAQFLKPAGRNKGDYAVSGSR